MQDKWPTKIINPATRWNVGVTGLAAAIAIAGAMLAAPDIADPGDIGLLRALKDFDSGGMCQALASCPPSAAAVDADAGTSPGAPRGNKNAG